MTSDNKASKRVLTCIALTLFLFLSSRSFFNHVEYGVYPSYTESIIEDGDFNIADEMYFHEQKKAITSSYYYPNFHSHSSSIMWAPFYLYGKLLASLFNVPHTDYNNIPNLNKKSRLKSLVNIKNTKKHISHLSMVLGACFLSSLGLILFYYRCRSSFPLIKPKHIVFFISLFFFGTPV